MMKAHTVIRQFAAFSFLFATSAVFDPVFAAPLHRADRVINTRQLKKAGFSLKSLRERYAGQIAAIDQSASAKSVLSVQESSDSVVSTAPCDLATTPTGSGNLKIKPDESGQDESGLGDQTLPSDGTPIEIAPDSQEGDSAAVAAEEATEDGGELTSSECGEICESNIDPETSQCNVQIFSTGSSGGANDGDGATDDAEIAVFGDPSIFENELATLSKASTFLSLSKAGGKFLLRGKNAKGTGVGQFLKGKKSRGFAVDRRGKVEFLVAQSRGRTVEVLDALEIGKTGTVLAIGKYRQSSSGKKHLFILYRR